MSLVCKSSRIESNDSINRITNSNNKSGKNDYVNLISKGNFSYTPMERHSLVETSPNKIKSNNLLL